MYADRVEAAAGRSVKERLNGNSADDSTRRRQITGKRQRQDDKWEHDLYENNEPRLSNRKVSGQDLRLKLQKKNHLHVKGAVSGVRDLREKLSGTMNAQPANLDPPKRKPETASQPARRSAAVEAPEPEIKKVATVASRKKTSQQKANTSLESFLQSLGLEKYLITFQVEEVDMTTLVHMTDEDLKVLGIPMGPRKKILLALESKG
ncbi:uncharacterized protein LOC126657668 [Mercurialis annua]|uniref:uncharacterized protein LOC126657668 n=1 Tax=Mercurialis annua TaxID=3986 RepID=UPI00215EBAEC|nr:uncharacterized protein LOC126657668 [Mercurialis annua]